MQDRKKLLWRFGLCAAALYVLLFPRQCAASVADGIKLCLERIVPSLFPYLVLSDLFLASGCAQEMARRSGKWMKKAFRVGSGGAIALLLGLTGGYPVGAKAAASLLREGIIEKRGAQQLLRFCNNAGPAFLFGVVGSVCYRSAAVGASLYAVHVLSAILCGLILRGKAPIRGNAANVKPLPPFPEAFLTAAANAGRSLVTVSLLVTVFTVLLGAIFQLFPAAEPAQVLAAGVLELSSGCARVASSSLPWAVKLPLTAAIVGWGGVCVHLQTMAAVRDAGLSVRPYLRAKALQAAISALIALPLPRLIRPAAQTFGTQTVLRPFSPLPWSLFSAGMICLIFLQFTTSNSEEKRL